MNIPTTTIDEQLKCKYDEYTRLFDANPTATLDEQLEAKWGEYDILFKEHYKESTNDDCECISSDISDEDFQSLLDAAGKACEKYHQ